MKPVISLSAVHGHCYIHVTSKSLSMEKSCVCISIMYTLYTLVYSIHGGYPNKLLNRLVPLVTHLVIPILMVFDLQIDNIALICDPLPRLPINAYIHKNYTPASLSSCLFI